MARVKVNPETGMTSVAVIIPVSEKAEKQRVEKPKVAKATREPLEVSDEEAAALKAEKGVDKDGNEVPAVVDAPEEEKKEEGKEEAKEGKEGKEAKSGDMTAKDLEHGGKKQK